MNSQLRRRDCAAALVHNPGPIRFKAGYCQPVLDARKLIVAGV